MLQHNTVVGVDMVVVVLGGECGFNLGLGYLFSSHSSILVNRAFKKELEVNECFLFAFLWVFDVACERLSRLGAEAICSAAFFCDVQQS